MRFWCCWEASEEANRWWMQSDWIAWSGKAREDKGSTSQLVAGAWRARVHRVDWGWRDFCYSCTPTYSLVDQFTAWGTAKRFLIEFFGFLFDNTSRCYIGTVWIARFLTSAFSAFSFFFFFFFCAWTVTSHGFTVHALFMHCLALFIHCSRIKKY